MNENKVYVLFRESMLQSICADLCTFGMLAFCIWFSHGSKLWSFICFVMLVRFVTGKATKKINTAPKFRTKAKLKEWAESL